MCGRFGDAARDAPGVGLATSAAECNVISTMRNFNCLFSACVLLAAGWISAGDQAGGPVAPLRFEEISVEAPFAMPAIRVPVFPAKDFSITDFGAVPGGTENVGEAIKKAIAACNQSGGGRVVIPRGKWLSGKVHFRSNVNLYLAEGAELRFSDNPEEYLPSVQSSWEGMECFNYSPLIYAFECSNVAITGKGTLRAERDTWEKWSGRPPAHLEALKQLYTMAAKGEPVEKRQMAAGENHLRPQFIQFNRCRNVLIEDVTIRNSPFWTIHLLLCDNVVARRLDISAHGHNNDGIDPEMTRNLLVEDCRFDQGDDAIAIKSGANQDGWRLHTPTENIVIRRCRVQLGHELVAIGSELSGGIRNVYVRDCTFESTGKPMNLIFIKTNRGRGGFVENIHVENITAGSVARAVLGIETDVLYQWRTLVTIYEERLTTISRIHIKNVQAKETGVPFKILGDAKMPVKDVSIENISIDKVHGKASQYENTENIHESRVRIVEFDTSKK